MSAKPKRRPYERSGVKLRRRHQEEALDEALGNTFPASDPVSMEQPAQDRAPSSQSLPVEKPSARIKAPIKP
jgi:hypothetical protein